MKIYLTAYNELFIIDSEQLLYLEADDHYTIVNYTSGAKFMVPFGLSRVEAAISDAFSAETERNPKAQSRYIIRVGRKFMLNMNRIFHISTMKQVVVLVDEHGENHSLHLPKPILRTLIDTLSP